ncbi:MAG: hypothetical protein ABJD13_06640 [Paracoccaceae bacterium]
MTDIHPDLNHKFQSWPSKATQHAKDVRALFIQTAQDIDVRDLEESLKWGEPAWRPQKGGTTLRAAWSAKSPRELGLFVDCKSDLCARMQADFPNAFRYVAPRAMYLRLDEPVPTPAVRHLARMAFRYKRVIPVH